MPVDAVAQFQALQRLAGLVDAPSAFELVAPHAAGAALELIGADGMWVCVRRRRYADLVLRYAVGIEPRAPSSGDVPIASDPLIELAVVAGRDLFMPDYVDADISDPLLRNQGVTSVATAPIAAGSHDLGALIAFRRGGPAFGPLESARLAQAGLAFALVLCAHEGRRDHARALARERTLAYTAAETAAAPDLTDALARIADGAAGVADAAFAAVLLYRIGTYYVPPTWGFVSLRWLERNRYL
jgi:hypothetical protein